MLRFVSQIPARIFSSASARWGETSADSIGALDGKGVESAIPAYTSRAVTLHPTFRPDLVVRTKPWPIVHPGERIGLNILSAGKIDRFPHVTNMSQNQ